jgi:hypothetical protein
MLLGMEIFVWVFYTVAACLTIIYFGREFPVKKKETAAVDEGSDNLDWTDSW